MLPSQPAQFGPPLIFKTLMNKWEVAANCSDQDTPTMQNLKYNVANEN